MASVIRSMLRGGRGDEPGSVVQHTVGNALVLHSEDAISSEAQSLALSVVEDAENDVVVLDLGDGMPIGSWESMAGVLPRRRRGIRLVACGRHHNAAAMAGQWLSERLNRTVIAPDGVLVRGSAGALFVHSTPGSGWVRFRPGKPPTWDSKRYPTPLWDKAATDKRASSSTGEIEPLPGGVWIHDTREPEIVEEHRKRLVADVPCQPETMTVLLGCPGTAPLSLDDVVRFWRELDPDSRLRTRFVQYGDVRLPEGEAFGQALADLLGTQVICYTGVPVGAPHKFEIRTVRSDGVLGWPPFALELGYAPRAHPNSKARRPAVLSHRGPLRWTEEISPRVYWYAPDAVVEVVQTGLWVRGVDEPPNAERVRATPLDPEGSTLIFDDTVDEQSARMRELAEDLAARVDPSVGQDTALFPASVLVPGQRPAGRAEATLRPAEAPSPSYSPSVQAVQAPPPASSITAGTPVNAVLIEPIEPTVVQQRFDVRELQEMGRAVGPYAPPAAIEPAAAQPTSAVYGEPAHGQPTHGQPPQPFAPSEPLAPAGFMVSQEPEVAGPGTTTPETAQPEASVPGEPLLAPEPVNLHESVALPEPAAPTSSVSPLEPVAPLEPVDGMLAAPVMPTGSVMSFPSVMPSAPVMPSAAVTPAVPFEPPAPTEAIAPPAEPVQLGIAVTEPVQVGSVQVEAVQVDPVGSGPHSAPAAPTLPIEAARPVEVGVERLHVLDPSTPPATPAAAKVEAEAKREPEARLQPVPPPSASALLPKRSIEEERSWLRRTLSRDFDVMASSVSRLMSEHPGLQASGTLRPDDVLADSVAVRLYLSHRGSGIDAGLRSGANGPHVPFARCTVSGLSRLPSFRGTTVYRTTPTAVEWDEYRNRRVVTDWAFVNVLTAPCAGQEGDTDVLVWSMTARRTSVLEPDGDDRVRDRVLFLPGTHYKILELHEPSGGERGAILMREIGANEISDDGRVDPDRVSLDELAATALRRSVERWANTEPQRRVGPGSVGRFGVLPGLDRRVDREEVSSR